MSIVVRPGTCRVVLRGMGANRGPGEVIAVFDDAYNVGASAYYNSPGEFHMTLPAQHEQAGLVEPWQTHYEVQQWNAGTNGYVTRFTGIISDFDANENDVILYGIDYLGLLDKVIDTRYVQGSPDAAPPTGSKHLDQPLSTIIGNLMTYAIGKTNSPVAFITKGAVDTFSEKVTIYTTFSAISTMVSGLVASHRQGTGAFSRFYIERWGTGQQYRWRLIDKPGSERPNLTFRYGELVQGFQVVGMGDFATKAHAIGRTRTGSELFYKSATSPGISQATWGSLETVDFIDNVIDANDLQRRVKQMAATSAKVGKRFAIGIRVGEVDPFEGYSITDHVRLDIRRGVVDTDRYGSGWWTVVGVEWRVKPDGSDETTLVLTPREDGVAPDDDLLASSEIVPTQPITNAQIPDDSISTQKIQDGAVDGDKIGPGSIGQGNMGPGSVGDPQIVPDGLDAGNLKTGELTVGGNPGDGTPNGIRVFDTNGTQIGAWDADGLIVQDIANPMLLVRLLEGELSFSDDGGLSWGTAINADGINASALRVGHFDGGSNRVKNSGLEIADFVTPAAKVWTSAADWQSHIASTDINVDDSTTSLRLTTVTY